jgi:hypothetical protein
VFPSQHALDARERDPFLALAPADPRERVRARLREDDVRRPASAQLDQRRAALRRRRGLVRGDLAHGATRWTCARARRASRAVRARGGE